MTVESREDSEETRVELRTDVLRARTLIRKLLGAWLTARVPGASDGKRLIVWTLGKAFVDALSTASEQVPLRAGRLSAPETPTTRFYSLDRRFAWVSLVVRWSTHRWRWLSFRISSRFRFEVGINGEFGAADNFQLTLMMECEFFDMGRITSFYKRLVGGPGAHFAYLAEKCSLSENDCDFLDEPFIFHRIVCFWNNFLRKRSL